MKKIDNKVMSPKDVHIGRMSFSFHISKFNGLLLIMFIAGESFTGLKNFLSFKRFFLRSVFAFIANFCIHYFVVYFQPYKRQ